MDLDPLPGQLTYQEVQQEVPQRLQVVPSALLVPLMRCDAGVAGGPDKALAALDGDVLAGLEVPEALGQSEVDGVDGLALLAAAAHEVVGLDVPVHEALAVDLLEARDNLDPHVEGGPQREPLLALS